MKAWLTHHLLRIAAPKIIRHAAVVVGTWLSSLGIAHGTIGEILMGGSVVLGSLAWSWLSRTADMQWMAPLSVHLRAVAEIAARAAMTASATLLSIPTEQLSSMSLEGMLMVALNIALSAMSDSKPDAPKAKLAY